MFNKTNHVDGTIEIGEHLNLTLQTKGCLVTNANTNCGNILSDQSTYGC